MFFLQKLTARPTTPKWDIKQVFLHLQLIPTALVRSPEVDPPSKRAQHGRVEHRQRRLHGRDGSAIPRRRDVAFEHRAGHEQWWARVVAALSASERQRGVGPFLVREVPVNNGTEEPRGLVAVERGLVDVRAAREQRRAAVAAEASLKTAVENLFYGARA